jgi:hypothetical protein
MGYLNGATVIVDAILTKHGRKRLAEGKGLGITKFACSDEGVDYGLWNTAHASGSAYYGEAITNLPMLEAVTDDSAIMRYKLTTLDRNTVYMPLVRITSPISLETQDDSKKISPTTENGTDDGYEFMFTDVSFINVIGGKKIDIGGSAVNFLARQEIPQAAAYTGKEITITAKPTSVNRTVSCIVTGTKTGAVAYVDLTVKKNVKTV